MSKRGKKLRQEIRAFVQQYGRPTNKNIDPNDRRYDRKIEALVKRMSPEQLDELLNGSDLDEE